MESTVNLQPYKLDLLQQRVNAIVNAFKRDSQVGDLYEAHLPQGSWPHQTIIRPVGDYDEFDADFLLQLTEQPEWEDNPKEYLRQVRGAFLRSTTYTDVRKKNRCVRIGYKNSCHVDVVPYICTADGRQVIVNWADNTFENTNPEGFTVWMQERDELAQGNLRKVLRLLKYIRDYKNTFTCVSVVLTTMVGGRIQAVDAGARYADIPTTLVTVLEDLRDWMALHPTMPYIEDPSCPGTSFNHRWCEERYQTFKGKVATYAGWARAAYEADTDSKALTAWQRLFGDEFVAPEVLETKAALLGAGRSRALVRREAPAPGEQFIEHRGFRVRPRYSATIQGRVVMPKNLYGPPRGSRRHQLRSSKPVPLGASLEFTLDTDAPLDAEVFWKIRNHGEAARRVGELRGEIRQGGRVGTRRHTESTKYPGQHYVEVYVVLRGEVVASDHLNVTIG